MSEDIGTQSSVSVPLCPSTPHRETRGNPDDPDHYLSPENQCKSQNPIVSHSRQPSTRDLGNPAFIRIYPRGRHSPGTSSVRLRRCQNRGRKFSSARIRSGPTPIHCSPQPWATRLLNIMKWQFVSRPLRSSTIREYQPIMFLLTCRRRA